MLGQQKKTRFQKIREEKEQKIKEEEEAAARVFDSFVASFEVDDKDSKTFLRGSSGKSDDQDKSSNVYKLSSDASKTKSSSGSGGAAEIDDLMNEIMVSYYKLSNVV